MSEQVDCRCSERSDPLWSYCSDDYFCPQCGEKVTRLISKYRLIPESSSDEVWVYAQKGKDQDIPVYTFPLAVSFCDQTRTSRRRKPTINFQLSKLEANHFFAPTLVPAEANNPDVERMPNRLYRVQLAPLGEITIPKEGVRLRVARLVGDFSDNESLCLRVGNKPAIRVELVGSGLEQGKENGTVVRVARAAELEVKLLVHAENAPICISRPLNNDNIHCSPETGDFPAISGQISLRIADELVVGTVIEPGTPWSTAAKLYAAALTIPGQRATVSLHFDVLAASVDQLALTLERVEMGGVEFDPNPFVIDTMYLGESRSNALNDKRENPEVPAIQGHHPVIRPLSIRNLGRQRIVLTRPTVSQSQPFEWLSVNWATDVEAGAVSPLHEQLELEPYDVGQIYIRVDLRNVPAEKLPQNRSLSATIEIQQLSTEEIFRINVTLQNVRDRTACPAPLCIDFGNTSSFASLKWHKEFPPSLKPEIADVHELRFPEAFHTVIFFKKIADDPLESECEIGDLAITEAEKFAASTSGALVSDLKRYIGAPSRTKTITDLRGHSSPDHTKRVLVSDLIVLFLIQLIERAERILRKYTIAQICVSHPSKFDVAKRHEFYSLIDRVCERVTSRRPPKSLRLTRLEADVDEANAVAVGTVFEREFRADFLTSRLQSQRSDFVVACLDLGGGSLDTALMRFVVVNRSLFRPRFQSEYLGIGGNSAFGGDNVTLAFMECLLDRIRDCLDHCGLSSSDYLLCIPDPSNKDTHSQAFARRNYQILWEVAEKVKLYQCRFGGLTGGAIDSQTELEPLCSFVQTRLVNDLVLMPRVTGRVQIDPAVATALKTFVENRSFLIPLPEVYDHKFRSSLAVQSREASRQCVRDHIQASLSDLKRLAATHNVEVDIIVLAGAGCRLPLVTELISNQFSARVINDPRRTKFRVAHGLVRFLDAATGGHDFACSSHYSTFAYELGSLDMDYKAPAIPNCASLRQPEKWYPVLVAHEWTNGVDINAKIDEIVSHNDLRRVYVFRVEEDLSRQTHGWFDLGSPPLQTTAPLANEDLLSFDATVEVRLFESEKREVDSDKKIKVIDMELRINLPEGKQYSWKFTPGQLEPLS